MGIGFSVPVKFSWDVVTARGIAGIFRTTEYRRGESMMPRGSKVAGFFCGFQSFTGTEASHRAEAPVMRMRLLEAARVSFLLLVGVFASALVGLAVPPLFDLSAFAEDELPGLSENLVGPAFTASDEEDATETTIVASGTCGDALTWKLESNGTLTISGTGSTYSYQSYDGKSNTACAVAPWKSYMNHIRRVVVTEGVTGVGAYAFCGYSHMQSLDLADTVTTIGDYGFSQCTSLENISLSHNLTSWSYAFANCTALETVEIPRGVSCVGCYAFSECRYLNAVTLSEGIGTVEQGAFKRCLELRSVELPDSITCCGDAFSECSSLESIYFGKNISSYTFSTGTDALCNIYVDEDNAYFASKGGILMSKDGKDVLGAVKSIAGNVEIPEGCTSIAQNAFCGCSEMTRIVLPDSIASIGARAFASCSNLEVIEIEEGASLTSIPSYAFLNCAKLQCVDIPASVTTINSYAFGTCTSLYSVTGMEGLKHILYGAFSNCTSLETFLIPNGVSEFLFDCSGAFKGCSSLSSIQVASDNPYFSSDDGVLYSKQFAKLVMCPQGKTGAVLVNGATTSIGNSAFAGCKGLTHIVLPEGLKTIGSSSFKGCSLLEELVIPDEVTVVNSNAFDGMDSLKTLVYPSSVTEVQQIACKDVYFRGDAPSVLDLTPIPEGLTYHYKVGTAGWEDSEGYDSNSKTWNGISVETWDGETIESSVLLGSGTCGDNGKMQWSVFSDGTLFVNGNDTLSDDTAWSSFASRITSVEVHGQSIYIGAGCFSAYTGLVAVRFAGSVDTIGASAFAGCTALEEVRFAAVAPTAIPAGEEGASFPAGITITYSDEYSGWADAAAESLGIYNPSAGTWYGYALKSALPKLASVAFSPDTDSFTAEGGTSSNDLSMQVTAFDEYGNDITDLVDISFTFTDPEGNPGSTSTSWVNYWGTDTTRFNAWFTRDGNLANISRAAEAGTYTLHVTPHRGKSSGSEITKSVAVERIDAYATSIISTLRVAVDGTGASYVLHNEITDNYDMPCQARAATLLDSDRQPMEDSRISFVPGYANDIVVDGCMSPGHYYIDYYMSSTNAGNIEIDVHLLCHLYVTRNASIPWAVSVEGDQSITASADEEVRTLNPFTASVIDQYGDSYSGSGIAWSVEDADGNDVSEHFSFDSDGYLTVKPTVSQVCSRYGTTFQVKATTQQGGCIGTAPLTVKLTDDKPYTVEHYLQGIDGAYPETPEKTEALEGATGAQTAAAASVFEGFEAPSIIEQAAIAEDGSTVVKLYYTRKSVNVKIDYVYAAAGGETPASAAESYAGTCLYGAAYSVDSPAVTCAIPDREVVSGTAGAADVSVTVVYTISHTWGSWETEREAVYGQPGSDVRHCEKCEAEEHRSVEYRAIDIAAAAADPISAVTWTGKAQTPEPALSYEGKELEKDVDYTLVYSDNNDAGTAKITVTGINAFTGTRELGFVIDRATIALPAAREGLSYTGSEQTGVEAGEGYSLSGETATDADEYEAVATPDANHCWPGGSAEPVSVKWSIAKAKVAVPVPDGTGFVYTGAEQTYRVEANGLYSVSGDKRTDAGTQTVSVSLADAGNYEWADGFSGSFEFTIGPAPLSVETDGASRAYDGTALTAGGRLSGLVNGETAEVVCTGSQTHAGKSDNAYRIEWGTAKASNYRIASEDVGALEVTRAAAAVTADAKSKVFGEADPALTATVSGVADGDELAYELSREPGEDAGEYAITVAGGAVQGDYEVSFIDAKLTVARAEVALPAAREGLSYTGSVQTGVEAGEGYSLSGETAADAGGHEAVATPDANHCWPGGSAEPVSVKWSIAKAAPSLSFDRTNVSATAGAEAFSNKLAAVTDGAVTYSSSAPAVASVDAETGAVTPLSAGGATITASAAEGANYLAGSASYSVTVEEAPDPDPSPAPADPSPDPDPSPADPSPSPSPEPVPEPDAGGTQVAGGSRYDTAAAIALEAYPDGADGVIVATGANFPDALGASSLAGMLGYPVVLTEPGTLTQSAADAIRELRAKEAIIVGGESAVSAAVEDALSAYGSVKRISGGDRYATARAVYAEGLARGAWGDTCIVATGRNYPDALSVSGYAFAAKAPIFLTDPESGLDDATMAAIRDAGFARAVIVGGAAAVPESDETWLGSACGTVRRLSGGGRYETSARIAEFVIAEGGSANGACIATGENFPDALAGSALAGMRRTVMLLASPGDTSAFGVLEANAGSITGIYFLGGNSAVPGAVRSAALRAARLG